MADNNGDFREFLDRIMGQVDIADLISGTPGFAIDTKKRGKLVYGLPTGQGGPGDSLMIDTDRGTYTWWSKGGGPKDGGVRGESYGDHFDFLEFYGGLEFMDAVRQVADLAGEALPPWEGDAEAATAAKSFKVVTSLYDVACAWLEKKLAATPAATAYAVGRGWTSEPDERKKPPVPGTIVQARLGFTGTGSAKEKEDLRGDWQMHSLDPWCPEAVAITGVTAAELKQAKPAWKTLEDWAGHYQVELQNNWEEKQRIYGMLDFPRLVYPHIERGRVVYFSGRNLKWEGGVGEGERQLIPDRGKYKTWNLPEKLCGPKHPYFNHVYQSRAEMVVLSEGPADGVTWGQWGVACVAMCGTGFDERLTERMGKHEIKFIGADNGDAGRKAVERWGLIMGPTSWVLTFPIADDEGEDANDWLQAMIKGGGVGGAADLEGQRAQARMLLDGAVTFVVHQAAKVLAADAYRKRVHLDALNRLIAQLDDDDYALLKEEIAKASGVGVRELNTRRKEGVKEAGKDKGSELAWTLGGVYGDWLLEYIYNDETDEGLLAYRNPEGEIGVAGEVVIDGTKFLPKPPNNYIRRKAVLFPSGLGATHATSELVDMVEKFVNKYYLLPTRYIGRIIAYYVLLTWIYDAFEALPYLRATGDAGSGKSELMKRVGHVCYRLTMASGSNTSATFFRTTEMFKGTVFIDEADLHDGGDMGNDLVKYLNLGAMKGNVISRLEKTVDANGKESYEPEPFETFGPKLIAMRKDFRDKAVGSRSLTMPIIEKKPQDLITAGVPLHIGDGFRAEALAIRNKLLRWRMENWVPQIALTEDLIDIQLSSRLNQVTMAIKALARGDEELMKDITKFLRAYALEQTKDRSMSIPAYVIEALWTLYQDDALREQHIKMSREGLHYFYMGDIRQKANDIFDDVNAAGMHQDSEGEGKKKPDGLKPTTVAKIIKDEIGLEKGKRTGEGIPIYWNHERMVAAGQKFGVLDKDEVPQELGKPPQQLEMTGSIAKEEREKWQAAGDETEAEW